MLLSLIFSLFFSLAFADIELSTTSSTYNALSSKISLSWTDDGTSPAITEYTQIKILLCTGPNNNINCFATLVPATLTSTLTDDKISIPLTPAATLGNNGAYYLQVVTYTNPTTFSIHYSDRFQLTGMSGVQVVASSGGFTSPPPPVLLSGPAQDPAQASKLAKTPYPSQTGKAWPTRYAPMQLQPGTTVTAKLTPSPRFPTSAVTYFLTPMPSPSILSTITMGWSYTFSSLTNYATPMPPPTLFYQASQVIASSIEAVSRTRAKRWID